MGSPNTTTPAARCEPHRGRGTPPPPGLGQASHCAVGPSPTLPLGWARPPTALQALPLSFLTARAAPHPRHCPGLPRGRWAPPHPCHAQTHQPPRLPRTCLPNGPEGTWASPTPAPTREVSREQQLGPGVSWVRLLTQPEGAGLHTTPHTAYTPHTHHIHTQRHIPRKHAHTQYTHRIHRHTQTYITSAPHTHIPHVHTIYTHTALTPTSMQTGPLSPTCDSRPRVRSHCYLDKREPQAPPQATPTPLLQEAPEEAGRPTVSPWGLSVLLWGAVDGSDPQAPPHPGQHPPRLLARAITSAAGLLMTLVTYRGQLACLAMVTARYTASASTCRRAAQATRGPGLLTAVSPRCPSHPRMSGPEGHPGAGIPAWGSSPESVLAHATLEQTALPSEPHMQASAWPAVRGPEALAHTPRQGQWGHSPACPWAQPTPNEGPLRGVLQVRTYLLGAAEHVALRTGDTEFQQPLLLLNTHPIPARPRRALRGCSPRPRTLGPETSESPTPEHLEGAEGGDSSSPNYGRGSPRAAEGQTCPGLQAS